MDSAEEIQLIELAILGMEAKLDHYKNRLAFLYNDQQDARPPRKPGSGRLKGSKNKPKVVVSGSNEPIRVVGQALENPVSAEIKDKN